MANEQAKIENKVVGAFTFVGKVLAMTIPVVAGVYMVRFIDRKILKGKVKTIAE